MATVNLLSIDWDYCFDLTADGERMECFQPICTEEYPEEVILFAWAACYAKYEEKLKSIKLLPAVQKIISSIPSSAVIHVCKSHRHAYEIFNRYVKRKDKVNLLNIDHHPDTVMPFNHKEPVHCGNWLSHFISEHNAKGNEYKWLSHSNFRKQCPDVLQSFTNIDDCGIDSTPWNIVVIARSDIWTPPHFDDMFTEIFKPIVTGRKSKGTIESGVWKSRYDEVFQNTITALQKPTIDNPELKASYLGYLNIVEQLKQREMGICLKIN